MAKRPSHRALRAARSYTFEEAATALGVSMGTIRIGSGRDCLR